ncbi:MAG: IS256 family transposase [Firmicutes bacterium]|nr:IS256 family transposase [Bacillota bacterium]
MLKQEGVESTKDLQVLMRGIMKDVIEALYDGEITEHLGYEKHRQGAGKDNSRNGFSKKTVQSTVGPVELEVPRDRKSEFTPKVIKKRQRDISGIEDKVISMYAKGMSTRDIKEHIYDIYGYEISPETVSNITDTVIEHAKEWQSRPLERVYAIVFMDALVVKLRVDGVVKNVALYAVIGINLDGEKSCLGLYISETESAKYWLTVMNELKNRGVEEVLIFAVDNLTGISSAIEAAFPHSELQKCIVHQIRNSLKFVSWKERKQVAQDLKTVYTAATEPNAREALESFKRKWDAKYPHISRSWEANWAELSVFFKYTPEIRKLIYTTNPIESFNRALRKVTKTRSLFPTEDALMKLMYLAVRDIERRWTQTIRSWGTIYSQLSIFFEERLAPYI